MSILSEDTDTLVGLEERILKAVEVVKSLKQENNSLRTQLETVTAERDEALAMQQHAFEELETMRVASTEAEKELELLRAERKQVKVRIEKLLGQMDFLA